MTQLFGPTWPTAVRGKVLPLAGNSFHRAVAFLLFLTATLAHAQSVQDSPSTASAPVPTARIELSAVGYVPPSRMDRLSEDQSSVSLGFIDADHVLLTFSTRKLFQRLPSCPPDHQDRMVHAAIIELPSGKVVTETDWYLHDRWRYLWPLSPGKFLLRKLNELFTVDSSLHEKLLWSSPKDLRWVAVTPDGGQIIVETAADADTVVDRKPSSPAARSKPEPKFVAQFLDSTTLTVRRTIPLNKVVDLSGTNYGYSDLVSKGDIWLIRFGPDPAHRRNIARVRSQTIPSVFYASNSSMVVGRCAVRNCDYGVTAFTVTGRRVWQQHWRRSRFFPAVAHNEDGSRFGVSTLRPVPVDSAAVNPGSAPYDPDDPYQLDVAQRDVFQQEIQIFETASGQAVLTVNASPAVMSGENFSLSPDGRRLAVLEGASLELFDLPQTSSEERSKFAALQTELPDVFAVAAVSTPDSIGDASTPQTDDEKTGEAASSTAPDAAEAKADASNSNAGPGDVKGQTPAADAQDSASASRPTPITEQELESRVGPIATFKIETRAVAVDVVVTDAKGHPIKGLKKEDFQVIEDGKPQEVRSFGEISDSDAPPPVPPVKPNPNVFSNDTRAPDPGARTLVLFDLLNTPSQDQVYSRQQLIKFFESKPKNSEFALCTLSAGASHLQLMQGFTPDETVLLAAAKGKKDVQRAVGWQTAAVATANDVSTVSVLAEGGRASGFQNLLGALQGMQAEQQGTDTDDRVSITLDSLMQLGRYLAGIPGRKNVVWLSGSFPISIVAPEGTNNSAAYNRNYGDRIRHVSNLLAEARIAVYPVDVRGLIAGGFTADSVGSAAGPPQEQAPVFSAKILAPNPVTPQGLGDLDQLETERETLAELATTTGGKAFYSSNAIKDAIATAAEQGANYYALSYSPTNKNYNGKYRKIKILLVDKKHTLHYRQGYFAENVSSASKDADISRRTRIAAMQHGAPPSRQILFSARVVPVGAKKKMNHRQIGGVLMPSAMKTTTLTIVDVQHYSIDYTLEGSQLHFMERESSTYRSVLTLMVASFDGDGVLLTGVSDLGISNLDPTVYKEVIGGQVRLHQEADVPLGAVSLRLGIQDQMNNHVGTIEIPLPVPPAPDAPRRTKRTLPEIEPD